MTEENTRVERAAHTGAVRLLIELAAGEIEVRAAHTDVAEVRLEPMVPGDEVAANLIDRATVNTVDDRFNVRVPQPANVTDTNIVAGRRVQGIQSAVGHGNVVVAGNIFGNVHVGGNMHGGVSAGDGGVAIGGAVRVVATVPSGSDVSGRTVSADLRVIADPMPYFATMREAAEDSETRTSINKLVFKSTSGHLEAVGARKVEATTVSGDITADSALAMNVSSTSGDVRAESLGGNLFVRTISGDIRAHAKINCSVQAESVFGDITVNRDRGLTVNVSARSVSGRVQT